jgi:2-octaprenyl-6-methoxyphenol hydroxylase
LRAYPLSFGVARRFIGERIALLGDAAHVIHPIAGQGLNLGLKDAASLAEAIVDAARLGLDPGGAETLAVYERARRFDTVAMGVVTDGLNRLFSNDMLPVRLIRDLGLGLVDRMPGLKRLFMREAAGLTGPSARLLRGEAL